MYKCRTFLNFIYDDVILNCLVVMGKCPGTFICDIFQSSSTFFDTVKRNNTNKPASQIHNHNELIAKLNHPFKPRVAHGMTHAWRSQVLE